MEPWQTRARQLEGDWAHLMQAANKGDAAAYDRLLTSLAPALRSAARRGLSRAGLPVTDAEDIVQEILLAIHLKRQTWDASLPFGPWLRAIARNKLVDAMRRRGRRDHVPIEEFAETLASETAETTPVPSRLDHHLQSLSERQRSVVTAISLNGASIREAAMQLEMSEGAVRVALHRGLATLAARFRDPNA
jgi:RNA polymerase sigma-70 factor, ECF subfamily